MKTQMTEQGLQIRWCIARDYKQVLDIDDCGYAEPLSRKELLACMKDNSVIGVVAEDESGDVVGYCIYQLLSAEVRIIRMAVKPRERRNGIATAMIDRLKAKVLTARRSTLSAEVDGHQIFAQHLLSRCGFEASVRPNDVIRFTFLK